MNNPMPQMPDHDPYEQPEPTTGFTLPSRFRELIGWVASRPKWMLLAGGISVVVIALVGVMLHKPSRQSAPAAPVVATPVSHAATPHHVVSKHKSHAKKSSSSHAKKHKKSHRKDQTQN
jgi:negative regulator of sigma E activity